MNKLNNLIITFPMILNLSMIFIMMIPMKINKFHPISLLIMLIMINFLICMKINFLKKSMISFILFLIMIGGLMVIFIYITSLSNNELFSINMKFFMMNFIKIIPLLILYLTLMIIYKQIILNNLIIESFQLINFNMNFKFTNIMYKESFNKSSIFLMMYLYYSMICIMNICYKLKSPLRQLLF